MEIDINSFVQLITFFLNSSDVKMVTRTAMFARMTMATMMDKMRMVVSGSRLSLLQLSTHCTGWTGADMLDLEDILLD